MNGWIRLCHRVTLSYIARIGTESLRAFRQKREEDIVEFIVAEYEEMVREGVVPLEDGKLCFTELPLSSIQHANSCARYHSNKR